MAVNGVTSDRGRGMRCGREAAVCLLSRRSVARVFFWLPVRRARGAARGTPPRRARAIPAKRMNARFRGAAACDSPYWWRVRPARERGGLWSERVRLELRRRADGADPAASRTLCTLCCASQGAGGGSAVTEVLPKAGLVYSEKGNLTETLCKPKLMPLKVRDRPPHACMRDAARRQADGKTACPRSRQLG